MQASRWALALPTGSCAVIRAVIVPEPYPAKATIAEEARGAEEKLFRDIWRSFKGPGLFRLSATIIATERGDSPRTAIEFLGGIQ